MNLLQRCISSELATMMYSFVKYIIIDTSWNQIVSLSESVLCNHIAFRFCRARVRSRRTENIRLFRILIDLILRQNFLNYIKSQFVRICNFYIDVCSRKRFARSMSCMLFSDYRFLDHFSFFSLRWHILWISYRQIT